MFPGVIGLAPDDPRDKGSPMTPKQCAAKLLLTLHQSGGKTPTQLTREEMTDLLGTRISDEKRVKVLEFVTKIESPFVERVTKISGEADGAAEGSSGA